MSGNSPLVSVLIPAYNHENYVQESIQSVIDQTYKNIELIVVDDGSKDSTWQKIQEMKEICEKRFSNIHFETKDNEGTSATLNKLLSLASGEYISILASDDKFKPQLIEIEYEFLSKHPDYVLCVGDNEIIDPKSKTCYWDKNRNCVYDIKKAKYKTFGDFLKKERKDVNFCSDNFGSYSSIYAGNYIPNGKLIRRSVFDKIGNYTKEAPLEDWWLMLQISKYGKMKYLDQVLFSYRWHESNTVKDNRKMCKLINKTRIYENNLLLKSDIDKLNKDVLEIIGNGCVYRKYIRIPYLFEILLSFKPTFPNKKFVTFKIINIKVFEYTINID